MDFVECNRMATRWKSGQENGVHSTRTAKADDADAANPYILEPETSQAYER